MRISGSFLSLKHVGCALCLALLLVSCGGREPYMHPDRSKTQEERDYQECLYEAQKSTGNLEDSGDRDDRIEAMVDSCMRSKGYAQ